MGLVEEFITGYRKEYDFYDQAARLVAQMLDLNLQAAGIRSMVTSRAKSITRLEVKVRQRTATKNYGRVEDIYDDIVDLAGVRVALYFPSEREQVDRLIKNLFVVTEPSKEFPADSTLSYTKRFSGYWATHYKAQMREASLSEAQKRYAEARVEIQVASVLMHAWAEVEHDLVYKPLQGTLSEDEYAILDELNGLVITGEIALERLQRAGEARVAAAGRRFSNHYDLAAHLLNRAGTILKGPLADTAIGRVDLLFDLLAKLQMITPESLEPYLAALHADTERRPIAEQIVDQLLAEEEDRYKLYEEVRTSRQAASVYTATEDHLIESEVHDAIGLFLSKWIAFERVIREMRKQKGEDLFPLLPTVRTLERLGILDHGTMVEIDRIRRLRNNLVHGFDVPDPVDLRDAATRLQQITERLSPTAGLAA